MDKTNIKVDFSIIGDTLHPCIATEQLKINPQKSWVKGDDIEGRSFKRKDTCWVISTEYEESLDINEQLLKVVAILEDKQKKLIELKRTYNVDYLFGIVVNIESNEKPTMYFDSKFIEFAHDIQAEFYIDLYIFS
ncbi:DUF4279 domain-containing protein [Anaerosinus gibii]|uniref:DUF4279 domain-containing protein n=1 Tax=Selenobaculum gibii TaxID=3054208 RepID=A0A9Y2AG39_9FIRM|nr:DUF4279 domain-containing protein [Selenobaculum gbiensis]WIW70179.1 DUF4279 domain-containing protein [Selenobaculum gbiensis]